MTGDLKRRIIGVMEKPLDILEKVVAFVKSECEVKVLRLGMMSDVDVKRVWRGCAKVEREWRVSVFEEISRALMI